MLERKCAPLAEASKGRVLCPDNFFKAYQKSGRCRICPKVNGRIIRPAKPLSDRQAEDITFRTLRKTMR